MIKERRWMLARPRQGHLLRGRAMRTPLVGVARRGRRSCPPDKEVDREGLHVEVTPCWGSQGAGPAIGRLNTRLAG